MIIQIAPEEGDEGGRPCRILEVSERTIYCDITYMVSRGVPIDGEAGFGYILRHRSEPGKGSRNCAVVISVPGHSG